MELEVGMQAPTFTLVSDAGNEVSLTDFLGKNVILYFYPKDNTPGCSLEAQHFNEALQSLEKAGYVVLGVSRDSVKKHCNFKEKYQLQFPLLADTEETVCHQYGVLKEKKNYGRTYIGIERSTFVIDGQGKLTHIFRNVKAKTHVAELLSALGV